MTEPDHYRTPDDPVKAKVTRYTLSLLPEDHPDWDTFAVHVEYRGKGRWAVVRGPYCLSEDALWEYEVRPSGREDAWLDAHRFDEPTALLMAERVIRTVTINRWTALALLAKEPAR